MKVVHTSDWHLGHSLHSVSRESEHRAFLAWLGAWLATEQPDLLLITGDVFDTASPSATSEAMWFGFLATAKQQCPTMDIVVIAGNHDSPAKLSAATPVLAALGVTVVASVPRHPDGRSNWDALVVPVCQQRALVAAVPFLRASDLATFSEDHGRDVTLAYREVTAALRAKRDALCAASGGPPVPVIVLGHLYAATGIASEQSERPLIVGGQSAIQPSMFPSEAAYVALGHLHKGQKIFVEHCRYAGSPIPLAMEERHNKHHVVLVEIPDATYTTSDSAPTCAIKLVPIPVATTLLRIPDVGAAPLPEIVTALSRLPPLDPTAIEHLPLLEICVLVEQPDPRLKATIDQALADRAVRLVKLTQKAGGAQQQLTAADSVSHLRQLGPDEVLTRLWHSKFGNPPPTDVQTLFATFVARLHEAK